MLEPGLMPNTKPDNEPIVIFALLLLQTPPGVASLNVMPDPTQTCEGPETGPGKGSIVITDVARHPVANK